jgi:hypothetical protein
MHKLSTTHRERARYAMMWRPRFLAVVALTRSILHGSRAAKVSRTTIDAHRKADPDFDAQVIAAQEQAVELVHDVAMCRVIEGDCEPIYWKGFRSGTSRSSTRGSRSRLLRAHMPDKFKTPGSKVNVNTGNQVFGPDTIIDRPVMLKLQEMRQESLRLIREKTAIGHEIASNDATQLGTGPTPPVPPTT